MPRKNQQLSLKARPGRGSKPAQRVELPPKTTCTRCGRETYTDASGEPRSHLRYALRSDHGFDERVPVMITCD